MKKFLFILSISIFIYSSLIAQNRRVNNFVSQEQTVNGFSNTFLGVDGAEPYIATNPRDPLNTICSFILGSYFTLDGLNWSSSVINNIDPFLSFDSLGNAYYTSLTNMGYYFYYYLRKSTDKGLTWQPNYLISNNADKECICANQVGGQYSNYLYSGWQVYLTKDSRAGDDIYFSRSTNFGSNWTTSALGYNLGYCPYIAIGPSSTIPGGIIYYGFDTYNYNDSTVTVNIKKSIDAGISFSPEIVTCTFKHPLDLKNGAVSLNACIQMSADNSFGAYRGNVYIVYTGKGTGNDKADIFFTKSTNYGDNWSSPLKLNDDNTLNDQWMPAISVDKYGKIYIVWYDSRIDPQNSMTQLYGTLSTNGGASFVSDFPVSTTPFNPALMVISQYMGHYISVSGIGNTAIAAWADGRNNNLGSYVGYFPDFAMTVTPTIINLGSNDSIYATIKIPALKGPYAGNVKFTYLIDSLPSQGNISFNFINKDSITTFPDSIYLKIKSTNVNLPGRYKLMITGRNTGTGVPVHSRKIDLLLNSFSLNIGTDRNGSAGFKVNGTLYNTLQSLFFPFNSNITVQAVSPFNFSNNKRYVFVNWSDAGDTAHSFVLNTNATLTANYKTQFNFVLVSSIGNSFGGNIFYDSAQSFTFGVLSKMYYYNGQIYKFTGWNGLGVGSYTSPDSTGNDTTVTLSMNNTIVEAARWIPVTGIRQISSEIPKEYKLYYAYPNPFNPVTNIQFSLPKNTDVKLEVFDITGRRISELINGHMEAGTYKTTFDASMYSSGVYFYRITADGFTDVKRMVMIK